MKKRISFICNHCGAELEIDDIFNHYIDDSNNTYVMECVSTCPYCHVIYTYEKAYKFVGDMNIEEHKVQGASPILFFQNHKKFFSFSDTKKIQYP